MISSELQLGACTKNGANYLVRQGTYVLKNLVSKPGLELLQKRTPQDIDIIGNKSPELKQLFGLLGKIVINPVIQVDLISMGGISELPNSVKSHTDTNAATGISALIPIIGSPGSFISRPMGYFSLEADKPLPNDCNEYSYGPGDVLLLRQQIESIDQKPISLPQVHHLGYGFDERSMLVVDFKGTHLDLSHFND